MRVFDSSKASDFETYLCSQIDKDVVAIVAEYVLLTQRGKHYVGRCPFHSEDVARDICYFPSYQKFICMSSDCFKGDIFDFVAKKKCIGRGEAIRVLANKLGIRANIFDETPQVGAGIDFRVSFSMLKQFEQCPFRYKYRYIDGKRDQKTTYYLALGRILHVTLAEFFRLDAASRSLGVLIDTLNKNWRGSKFPKKEEGEESRVRAEEILTGYYNSHDCNSKVWAVEKSIECKTKGLAITGTIDRIDELPGGGYEIVEYKTEQLDSSQENMNAIQLAFYYYGAVGSLKLPVKKLTLEYLPSQQTISLHPDEAELDLQLRRALDIVQEIHETTGFRPKRNAYCMDCVLSSTCPECKY